jgi:hypothetical protein
MWVSSLCGEAFGPLVTRNFGLNAGKLYGGPWERMPVRHAALFQPSSWTRNPRPHMTLAGCAAPGRYGCDGHGRWIRSRPPKAHRAGRLETGPLPPISQVNRPNNAPRTAPRRWFSVCGGIPANYELQDDINNRNLPIRLARSQSIQPALQFQRMPPVAASCWLTTRRTFARSSRPTWNIPRTSWRWRQTVKRRSKSFVPAISTWC